ncbi:MAG: DMT family transporter [Cyanobacteria bacterium P01_G01_bin.54]
MVSPFFLWGTAMVAMKGVLTQTTPLFLAGVRLVPAGILILLVAAGLGLPQPRTGRAWAWIGLFALLDALMFQGFLAEGLVRTGAGLGSVMIDSQPLAIALLSSWLFAERIGGWGWLGLLVGILGISLIGLPSDWWLGWWQHQNVAIAWDGSALLANGQWWMLLAALAMATGTVTIRYVSRHADPVVATGWHMILGGLPLWGLSALWETGQWQAIDGLGWLELGYATILGSAIAYGVFFYIAAQGNLTSFTALTFLTPVFALLFSALLLGEVLNAVQWPGVLLTLVSIVLINQRDRLRQWGQPEPDPQSSGSSATAPVKVETE